MRHVYNSFAAMTEGAGRDDDYWRRERKTDGLVVSARASSYFRNTWGDPGNLSACTDSFVNFGQAPPASTACAFASVAAQMQGCYQSQGLQHKGNTSLSKFQ